MVLPIKDPPTAVPGAGGGWPGLRPLLGRGAGSRGDQGLRGFQARQATSAAGPRRAPPENTHETPRRPRRGITASLLAPSQLSTRACQHASGSGTAASPPPPPA